MLADAFLKENSMSLIKSITNFFSKAEIALWSCSAIMISLSYFVFSQENFLTLVASLMGVTAILFAAKGNPFGQLLMIAFCIIYGIISYSFTYYGEMLTYLGMSMPMAIVALISWIKNPSEDNKTEVKVNRKITGKEAIIMWASTVFVTVIFYFLLRYFGTANLIPSTLSVSTSFLAVYLTAKRSCYFAVAYAANDVLLIVLWTLASITDIKYVSVVVCFIAFLANDIYCFINWQRMKNRQEKIKVPA